MQTDGRVEHGQHAVRSVHEGTKVRVSVRFSQQQIELLDKLKRDGLESRSDIVAAVLHAYLGEAFGKGRI